MFTPHHQNPVAGSSTRLRHQKSAPCLKNHSPLELGEHEVTIRNVRLWYLVRGTGPVLVVQPGGAGWGGDVWPYIELLAPLEKFRTVVYLEPRGLGRSERLENSSAYAIDEYVDDVEALRHHLGVARIAVLGHSHGGFVALKYALRFPAAVECLALISTTPCLQLGDHVEWLGRRSANSELAVEVARIASDSTLSLDDKHKASLLAMLPIIHFFDYEGNRARVDELFCSMNVSAEPYQWFTSHEASRYDLRDSLSGITAPTLVFVGDDDMPAISIGSELLREGISNATLLKAQQCGHWPMIEAPQSFFNGLIRFLSRFENTAS